MDFGHVLDVFFTAIVVFVGVICALVVVAVFIGYPVKWMMNYLFTPSLLSATFGVPRMTFWRAFWLFILLGFVLGTSGIRLDFAR
jgi:hypothetical protein